MSDQIDDNFVDITSSQITAIKTILSKRCQPEKQQQQQSPPQPKEKEIVEKQSSMYPSSRPLINKNKETGKSKREMPSKGRMPLPNTNPMSTLPLNSRAVKRLR